ncbi:MAG: DoxX family membrane protein [Armatimonadetes bacterium]|nr:DoxX family membrane protein [Armatimonadota bacterium]
MALVLKSKWRWVVPASRIFLGGVMIVAAITKVQHPQEIIATIDRSGLFPPLLVKVVAYSVIFVELLISVLLMLRKTLSFGFVTYAGFSSLLFGYSLWRWLQDLKAPCSCFGALLKLAPWQSATFAVLTCALAFQCLRNLHVTQHISN